MVSFSAAVGAALNLSCEGSQAATAAAENEQSWSHLNRKGVEALDSNRYWLAEPLLKESVSKAELFGVQDIRLANSLGELGRLYTIRGRFSEAEPYLERELSMRELSLGKDEGQTIPAMGALIRFYLNYGTAAKADPLTEEILGFVQGKMMEPTIIAQSALKAQPGAPLTGWCGSATQTMRDPLIDWAITCDSIGGAYLARGNYAMAERLFKAALDLKATVLGKGHLSLALSYDSLGNLSLAKKELKDAESYFRDALTTTENTLAPESPEVYNRLDRLAKCLIKEGKYAEAEQLYIRAQSFWKKVPSKGGDEARCLYALGCLYIEQKNYAAAAPALAQALHMAERFSGPQSIQLVPYLEKYAYALYYLGRRGETNHLRARANFISG